VVAPRSKPYQLLIADDDRTFREILRDIFEPYLGFWEAGSGEEAIQIVEHNRVDVVLLDMHMEILTGLETIQIVKSMNAVVPCILVTADATAQLKREASEADAYSVLEKPVLKADLMNTVSTALNDTYCDPEALPSGLTLPD